MSRPSKEQLRKGYEALREAGFDPVALSQAMTADGLSPATAASTTMASARKQLDRLKRDPEWFRKLMAGDSETTAEYERLNKELAG